MKKRFSTTRWSLVLAAGEAGVGGRSALSELCELYWYPVYAFIRRRRGGHEAALDLTQEFFSQLLAESSLRRLDPAHGRFRSWLLRRVKNLLANEWDRSTAKKRDHRLLIWLDAQAADERYALEPKSQLDPERMYECNFAYALLERSVAVLAQEEEDKGNRSLIEQLAPLLLGPEAEGPDYAPYATVTGMSPEALRAKVSRLRKRLRQIRDGLAGDIVESQAAVQDELGRLFSALCGAES